MIFYKLYFVYHLINANYRGFCALTRLMSPKRKKRVARTRMALDALLDHDTD